MSRHYFVPHSLLTSAAAVLLRNDGELPYFVPRSLRRCLRADWFLGGEFRNLTMQSGWDKVIIVAQVNGAKVTLQKGQQICSFTVPFIMSMIRSNLLSYLLGLESNTPVMGQCLGNASKERILVCHFYRTMHTSGFNKD